MRQITITLYKFDELSDEAKFRVIKEEIDAQIELFGNRSREELPNYFVRAIDKTEQFQTPWFLEACILEFGREELEYTLRSYGNAFQADGEMIEIEEEYDESNP